MSRKHCKYGCTIGVIVDISRVDKLSMQTQSMHEDSSTVDMKLHFEKLDGIEERKGDGDNRAI